MRAAARSGSVAVLVRDVGPYHHARFQALARRCDLTVVEWGDPDRGLAYSRASRAGQGYGLIGAASADALAEGLKKARAQALMVPGWWGAPALAGIRVALGLGLPMVVASESGRADRRRRILVEWVKRGVLKAPQAALVGGQAHAAYLRELGFRGPIELGYDAVDNRHFMAAPGSFPARPHFFVCSRLIPEKGIDLVLRAYALYRDRALKPWPLQIAGTGPEEAALKSLVKGLRLAPQVSFLGRLDYERLPVAYAQCGALLVPSRSEPWGLVVNEAMAAARPVLVSEKAGSAEWVTGSRCGEALPLQAEAWARAMQGLSDNRVRAASLGRLGRVFVRHWGPERFAEGAQQAFKAALSYRRPASLAQRSLGALARASL